MTLLRPRYAAAAAGAYFAIVIYLAWDTARQTTGSWYDQAASQVVYQTTIVGGILLIAVLFVVASMHPRLAVVAPADGTVGRLRRGRPRAADMEVPEANAMPRANPGPAGWTEIGGFLDSMAATPRSARVEMVRIRDTEIAGAASTGALAANGPAAGTMTNGVASEASVPSVAAAPEARATPASSLELVNEVRSLLVVARRVGINGRDIWRLAGEPRGGDDIDFAQKVRILQHVKEIVETAVVQRIREDLEDLLVGIQTMNAAADRARTAELTVAEAITLLDTGNYLVSVDRAERARDTLRLPRSPEGSHAKEEGRSSWVALAGPAVGALGYVAASAMLLPGFGGYLEWHYQLNTAAILVMSYGWVGLLAYSLVSVYMTLRSAPNEPRRRSTLRV